jgi:hypothetical protein
MYVMSYFSERQFQTFLARELDRLRLGWLALAGRVLTGRESEELRGRLEDFFRSTDHRSFKDK